MKKLLVLLFITPTVLTSQYNYPHRPYEQLEFEGLEPLWYATIYDSTLDLDSCDGYNVFWQLPKTIPFIKGDYVYSVLTHKPYKGENFGGTYLEKRNWMTGDLMWYHRFDMSLTGHQEAARLLHFDDDGNLELISQRRVAPYSVGDPSHFAFASEFTKLSRKVFDESTGDMLSHYSPNLEDSSIIPIVYSNINPGSYLNHMEVKEFGNRYRVFQNKKFETDFPWERGVYAFDLDGEGRMVGTIDSFKVKGVNGSLNLIKLSSGLYLYMEENYDEKYIKFHLLDVDLNLIRSIDVEVFPNYNRFDLLDATEDRILMRHNTGRHPSRPYNIYEICVFDFDGRLLSRSLMDSEVGYSVYFDVIHWETGPHVYVLAQARLHDESGFFYTTLDLLKSNDAGSFDIVNRFKSKDRLRGGAPDFSMKLPNGKYLVTFFEIAWVTTSPSGLGVDPDYQSQVRSMMVLDPADLGLFPTTDVVDSEIHDWSVRCAPNPSQDFIDLEFDQAFSGTVRIISTSAQLVRNMDVNQSHFIRLDLANVPGGIYSLECLDRMGRRVYSQRMVKLD